MRRPMLRDWDLEPRLAPSVSLVREINPGANNGGWFTYSADNGYLPVEINGISYFLANDGITGFELWRSDGTSNGTILVKDIRPGALGSFPEKLTNVNGTLFFTANDGTNGIELWKSDGTSAGTSIVRDLTGAGFNTSPEFLTNLNGILYFSPFRSFVPDGGTSALWRSDGTSAGTTIVAEISPYGSPSYVQNITNANGVLLFSANYENDNTNNRDRHELYRSDGTSAGTFKVKDICPVNNAFAVFGVSPLSPITTVAGISYFRHDDNFSGDYDLWRTDGTSAGTFKISDVNFPISVNPTMHNAGGKFFFTANNPSFGYELWTSDGTSAGTFMVKDLTPGAASGNPSNFSNIGDTLYFAGPGGFWKSDGTSAGTTLVKAIGAGPAIEVNGQLIFSGNDGTSGSELWTSDGTAAGTVRLADIVPGATGSLPIGFVNSAGGLLFFANNAASGIELWKFSAGAAPLSSITSPNPNGTYTTGQSLTITLNWPELVTLSGGNLLVTLDSGVTLTIAPFSGTTASTTYTIANGQASGDLNVVSLALAAGATLVNGGGLSAYLGLPASNLAVNKNLMINLPETPPTISNVTDQTLPFGTASTGALTVTVGDTQTPAANLTLSAASSNTALVPLANIVFGGSGANRTVTITPAAGQSGSATITLTVRDGANNTATDTFVVTVLPNALPTISNVTDRTVANGASTGSIAFTVGDTETPAASLTVSAASSNTALVPLANIVFGGSGANRTVTVTPVAGQSGTCTITLTVSDGSGTASDTFVLTVLPNSLPTISDITDRSTPFGTSTGAINFTIGDSETPAASLVVTRSSSNPTLVPLANVVLGGSGANRTVTITPAAGQSGTSTITLTVTDAAGGTASDTFVLTVDPNQPPTISDITDKTVAAGSTLGPIAVTLGDVEAGTLTLTASSDNPTLIPNGAITLGGSSTARTISIASPAGQNGTATITLVVTDAAGATATDTFILTVNTPPTISDIDNQAGNAGDTLGPIAFTVGDLTTAADQLTLTAFSSNQTIIPNSAISFAGSGANRTLSIATTSGVGGSVSIQVRVTDGNGLVTTDSFTVTLTVPNTPPSISDIADQSIPQGGSLAAVAFTISDTQTPLANLVVTTTSSNATLVPNTAITLGGSSGNRTIAITPTAGFGTSTITVTVSDGTGFSTSDTFVLTVVETNTAPTISDTTNKSTAQNTPIGPIAFTIGDGQTPVANLVVTATSSNATLVPNAAIVLGGSGANRTVTITPATGQSGVATITLTVSDGTLSTSDTFLLSVSANSAPTISDVPNQTTPMSTTLGPIAFTVGDSQTPAANLTVSAHSSNSTIVPNTNIVFGGSGANRTVTITPIAGMIGNLSITLTVSDGSLTATDSFTLAVTAPPNEPPTISAIADQSVVRNGTLGPIAFTIGDALTNPVSLTLAATSSNGGLIPTSGIVFGGSGANRTVTITPSSGGLGASLVTIIVGDGQLTTSESFVVTVTQPPLPGVEQEFSVGSDKGIGSSATLRNPDNTVRFTVTPFPGFTGGLRTTAGDFTGDGIADLAVASGPGRPGEVAIFDGVTQARIETPLPGNQPFGSTFTRGIILGSGDLNNDGKSDLIITAEAGGGARVRIFQSFGSGFVQRSDFIALIGGDNKADGSFRGGSRATVSDINGDGVGDLIWAAGAGGGPRIATFDGKRLDSGNNAAIKLTGDFFALSTTLRDGCYLAGGDIDGDGIGDIVFGGGSGAPPQVVAYSGKLVAQNNFTRFLDFTFGNPATRQGVRVALKDLDGDNRADLIVGSAPSAGSRVAAYSGKNLNGGATGAALFDVDAFGGFTGGVFVG